MPLDREDQHLKKDQYELVKEELGYNDEEIRALSKFIKLKALGVFGSKKERQLTFLMKEQEKLDKARIEECIGILGLHREKSLRSLCQLDVTWWNALAETYQEYGDRVLETLIAAKNIYGDDQKKFLRMRDVYRSHAHPALQALIAAKNVYGDDQEKFLRVLDMIIKIAKKYNVASYVLSELANAPDAYGDSEDRFKIFAELAKNYHYSTVGALIAAKNVYGDDQEKFLRVRDMVTEVAKISTAALNALTAAKDAYGGSEEKFKVFVEVAKISANAVQALAVAKDVYGDDQEKLLRIRDMVTEVAKISTAAVNGFAKARGERVVRALTEAKDAYGDSEEKFKVFVEVAKISDAHEVNALAKAKDAYGGSEEKFKVFAEVAKNTGGFAVEALAKGKNVYRDDHEKFLRVRDMVKTKNADGYNQLYLAENAYGDSEDRFKVFVEVAKISGGFAVKALAAAKDAYGDSEEKFLVFAEVAKISGECVVSAIAAAKDVYGDDQEKFLRVRDMVIKTQNAGREAVNALAAAKDAYGESEDKFKVFAELSENSGKEAVKALADAKDAYTDSPEMFLAFVEIAKQDSKIIEQLVKVKTAYGQDTQRLQIAVTYFEDEDFNDADTVSGYIDAYLEGGQDAGRQYLANLKQQAKKLIGSDVPAGLRMQKGYKYMVVYVFPAGNYSNHESNLACGDKLEHVKSYKFEREGYPTEMSGLKGYKLVEGQTENMALLAGYQGRLDKIRTFVASRGPDNKALQEAFEKRLDEIFKSRADVKLQALENLTLHEKMLALFITEVSKKSQQKSYKPDSDILDLIIEYKYAFCENLEGYIQRTADETKRIKDTVSQNFNLWRELSTIYGENLKHVLRHDIFENLTKEGNHKEQIEDVFGTLIQQGGENLQLDPGSRKRLEDVFDNQKIPEAKKFGALNKPVKDLFFANIRFKNDELKKACESELASVLNLCRENMNKEFFFSRVVPKLFAVRRKYLFDLAGQLEELFGSDINKISQEISKYEEVVETENKETRIGGEKHKAVQKRSKKRNIRGFITKTQETANARMGAYLCIAGDKKMWENKNYFELVMKDEESGKCVGVAMLLNIEAKDGKKYLWFGPNPFEGFLGQVSAQQCYKYMYDTAAKFATENGFDGIVVPPEDGQILGACTNRGGDFPDLIKASRLRDAKGHLKIVEFGAQHQLGGSYGYEKGALIWDKKVAMGA